MSSTAIVVCIIFCLTLTTDYTDRTDQTDTGHPQLTRPAKFKTAIALDAGVAGRANGAACQPKRRQFTTVPRQVRSLRFDFHSDSGDKKANPSQTNAWNPGKTE
jgi:hypothetical protein